MYGIHIVSTGRTLPKNKVTNHDLGKIVDTYDEWIVERTGISQRYLCQDETCASLAISAAKKAVEEAVKKEKLTLDEIGVIIVATSSGEFVLPSTASLIQDALGIPTQAIAFDIGAACSGFLYGLQVCRGLLRDGNKKYALLVGSEELSRIMDFTDRSSCILFGDGAGAVVLRLDEGFFYHKSWSSGNTHAISCKGVGNNNAKILMDGKEVFRFAVKALRQGIDEVLKEASMTLDDVDYIVCHQANKRIIEHVMKKLPGYEHKFYINIDKYANTSAASIPIVLDEMNNKKLLRKGDVILMVAFGAGLTWGSAIFNY